MNKLTKVGCSALCGSLAAISAANAGDVTVTGTADLSFSSLGHATTGNPIGMGSNFNLKGSGELDNGWTHSLTIAFSNVGAYSAANIGLTMGGLGSININQGNSGNGIAAYDDKMPTAWEESWGAGLSTGIRLPLGSGASQNIMYTTPASVPGVTLALTYAHDYGSSDIDDKTTKSSQDANSRSYDATLNINPSLGTEILSDLNIFVGGSTIESVKNNSGATADRYEAVGGLTYSLGPVSVGAQWSGDYTGVDDPRGSAGAVNAYNLYKAHAFGVAFNVNDNLSVSYGEWTHRKAGTTSSETVQGDENTKVIHVTSIQAAYTMGGASIRIADSQADNVSWSAGNNKNATVVSLGLAF